MVGENLQDKTTTAAGLVLVLPELAPGEALVLGGVVFVGDCGSEEANENAALAAKRLMRCSSC